MLYPAEFSEKDFDLEPWNELKSSKKKNEAQKNMKHKFYHVTGVRQKNITIV